MKPQEILGMLEEAAGTRMYETKKEAALRTLEKKQVKVQEIEKVLLRSRSPSASTAHPLSDGLDGGPYFMEVKSCIVYFSD